MPVLLAAYVVMGASPEPSPADRAWADAHPAIRVAQPLGGPFAVLDPHGELTGLNLDYLDRLAARTGLHFESIPVVGVNAAIDGVREGRYDAVMGLGRMHGREEVLRFGLPYAYSPDAIVGHAEAPFLFDIRQLGGRKVALARSSEDLVRRFATEVPDAVVSTYETMDQAILAVERRDAFVAVVDASFAAWFVKQRALADLRVSGVFGASPDMYLAVRRDWPELVRLLDRGIEAMPAAERTEITNRWMVLDYASDRRWQRAFRTATGVLAVALLGALALVVFNRRMRRELSLRRRIQTELEEARDRLARTSADKSELMRMIAHDLRSPLGSLLVDTQHLLEALGPDEGEAREVLVEMSVSIDRMRSLVGVLTDVHALESGARTWRWSFIDPGEEVRAAALAAGEVARRKGVEVVARIPADLPGLESDREAFREVVDNLLSNAVKFSPAGTRVQADAAATSDAIRIAVRDEGPGVPPAERQAIFDKYGVGSARPTAGEPSTGLGLWIVDSLVRSMSGRVWCEDAPGGGAAFCVELPLAPGPAVSRART